MTNDGDQAAQELRDTSGRMVARRGCRAVWVECHQDGRSSRRVASVDEQIAERASRPVGGNGDPVRKGVWIKGGGAAPYAVGA